MKTLVFLVVGALLIATIRDPRSVPRAFNAAMASIAETGREFGPSLGA